MPSRSTTGKSTCESPVVSASAPPSLVPTKIGITVPAARMKIAVIAPSAISMIQKTVDASRNASRLRPSCSSSLKTGTKAADSAAFANRLATRFGTWNASVNAEYAFVAPKKLAASTSRASPAIRENPVATEKIAVFRATWPCAGGASRPARTVGAVKAAIVRPRAARAAASPCHGQHRLPEEADRARRARTPRKPPLHVCDQDVLPPPRGRRRRGRRGQGRERAPHARLADRQGDQ